MDSCGFQCSRAISGVGLAHDLDTVTILSTQVTMPDHQLLSILWLFRPWLLTQLGACDISHSGTSWGRKLHNAARSQECSLVFSEPTNSAPAGWMLDMMLCSVERIRVHLGWIYSDCEAKTGLQQRPGTSVNKDDQSLKSLGGGDHGLQDLHGRDLPPSLSAHGSLTAWHASSESSKLFGNLQCHDDAPGERCSHVPTCVHTCPHDLREISGTTVYDPWYWYHGDGTMTKL